MFFFWRFSGIFCLWTNYRPHPLTQVPISLVVSSRFSKFWSVTVLGYFQVFFGVFRVIYVGQHATGYTLWPRNFAACEFAPRAVLRISVFCFFVVLFSIISIMLNFRRNVCSLYWWVCVLRLSFLFLSQGHLYKGPLELIVWFH